MRPKICGTLQFTLSSGGFDGSEVVGTFGLSLFPSTLFWTNVISCWEINSNFQTIVNINVNWVEI